MRLRVKRANCISVSIIFAAPLDKILDSLDANQAQGTREQETTKLGLIPVLLVPALHNPKHPTNSHSRVESRLLITLL